MKLRVKFRKYGPVKFIGHLDTMRFFQKGLRRADIDVCYSSGFSPHQIMSFASPLGVGLESNGEYMDVEVNTPITSREFIDRFQKVTVEGFDVVDVRALPKEAGNAMASVSAAGYTIRFRPGRAPVGDWKAAFKDYMEQEEIKVIKATKRGTAEIDLKPAIFAYQVQEDGIYLLTDASSGGNIKPSLVIEHFYKFMGQEMPPNACCITREETYGDQTQEDGTIVRVPLSEFGAWIS